MPIWKEKFDDRTKAEIVKDFLEKHGQTAKIVGEELKFQGEVYKYYEVHYTKKLRQHTHSQHSPRRTPKRELTETLTTPLTFGEKTIRKNIDTKFKSSQVRGIKRRTEKKLDKKIKTGKYYTEDWK